jgi:enoyl-CoA hydratase/carnithine racemase
VTVVIDDLAVEGLRTDWRDGVLWLVLDRPDARNALTIAMRRGLMAAVRAADADPETRVIVLTGTDPAFSGGVDLQESLGGGAGSPQGARTDPAAVFRACRTPIIAAVNGACYTGALELALSCSFLIASDRARFADTHASVGLVAGWGLSALLPRAVGVRMARQMMTTGEPIGAAAALRAGLVTEVVPHALLLDRAGEIAAAIGAAHPGAVEVTLGLLAAGEGATLPHALALEAEARLRWRIDPAEVARRFTTRPRRSSGPPATPGS